MWWESLADTPWILRQLWRLGSIKGLSEERLAHGRLFNRHWMPTLEIVSVLVAYQIVRGRRVEMKFFGVARRRPYFPVKVTSWHARTNAAVNKKVELSPVHLSFDCQDLLANRKSPLSQVIIREIDKAYGI